MRVFYKILTLILLVPTVYFLFLLGGIPLVEGYNVFSPYIDTEFGENYTPKDFDKITMDFTKNEVLEIVGKPLFISEDSLRNEIEYVYTNDAYLTRKTNRNYLIRDFAWYRSRVYFDSTGKVIRIDKGWSYD